MRMQPKTKNAPEGEISEALSVNNPNQKGINMSNSIALTIGTTSVREVSGLYSLNDLHKAAGSEEKNKPALFLRNDQAQSLIEEIGKGTDLHLFLNTVKGRNGGTYACRELVIAYAAWISAAFHLKVIRVFLDAMQTVARPHNPAIDYDRISPAQKQDLKEIVDAIVKAGIQTYGETWNRLQRKFRVNAYAELPATQHMEARQYLIAKLPGGYAGEGEAELPGKLPEAIASSAPTLRNRRWLLATDFEGREVVQPIPDDASIISFTKDSYYGIVERIPMERLPDMLAELQKRVACHIGAFSARLQRDNAQRTA